MRSRGDDLHGRALRAAYAIDMAAPRSLTLQRIDLAIAEKVDIDTIKVYENTMIKELVLRLVHSMGCGSVQ